MAKKLTMIGRAASGVSESAADLDAPYETDGPLGDALNQSDVAIVGVSANDLALAIGPDGNAVNTTAPLGTTTYTSKVFKTQGFGRIVGTVFSDSNGTLKVQQSNDGVHFDQSDSVAVTGGTGTKFSIEVCALYGQFVYTPSASQATFRFFPLLRRLGSA